MRANTFAALILLLPIVAFADEAKDLAGTWKGESGMAAGEKLPQNLASITLVLSQGKYLVRLDDTEIDNGTVKLDEKKNPKQFEIVSTAEGNKGKTLLAIYELKGDTLKVCYDLGGKMYPTEFASTKENKCLLITYKRVK